MSEEKNWFDNDDDNESNQDSTYNNSNSGNNGYNNENRDNGPGYGNSGYYQYDSSQYIYRAPRDPQGTNSRFGGAAFGCGIASIGLLMTGFFSVILGALGILFATMSKRRGKGYPSKGRVGLITSVIGLILGMIISVYSVMVVLQNKDAFLNDLNETYKTIYGEELDLEEYFNMFGEGGF